LISFKGIKPCPRKNSLKKGGEDMEECVFCRIVNREIPSEIVYEDDQVLVFRDIEPEAPVHLLAIPKKHVASLNDADQEDRELLGSIQLAVAEAARRLGFADSGYRIVNNCGAGAGQVVMHLHYHVLSGRPFSWPCG